MAQKIDIFNEKWTKMIFEDRNQEYGAFFLRKINSKNHFFALLIGTFFFVLGFTAPVIIKKMDLGSKEKDVSVRVLSELDLDKPKEKENDIQKELPPPEEKPLLKNVIKFTPPVIKPDEEVAEEEEMKTQEQVTESKSAIGNINYDKGSDDINAEMPEEMPEEHQVIVGGDGAQEEAFRVVEEMPEFPGGDQELLKFLYSNIKYPPIAAENGIEGKVTLSFIVEKNGSVSNVKVLRGIGGGCDEEAMRVLRTMPAWSPGKQGKVAVRVYYTLPVVFKLQG